MRWVAVLLAGALAPVLLVPGGAAAPGSAGPQAWNILPPGQAGTVDAAQLGRVLAVDPLRRVAVQARNAPPHFADQLERYDALNTADPASLTEADLGAYYKPAGLDVAPGQVARVERPRPGVTVTWVLGARRTTRRWARPPAVDPRRPHLRRLAGGCRLRHDVAALRYDKTADAIRPVTAGVVGTRPIDWQNRPTFQQVVRFRSAAAEPGLVVPGRSTRTAAPGCPRCRWATARWVTSASPDPASRRADG